MEQPGYWGFVSPETGFSDQSMVQSFRAVLIFVGIAGVCLLGWTGDCKAAAGGAEQATEATAPGGSGHEEQAIPAHAVVIGRIGSFEITNSMLVSWIVALGLIVFAQVSMKHVRQIPAGAQNFCEWLVETLHNFLEGIIGRRLVSKTFWFFATIFIFILFSNWLGLIPGVGTVGWGTEGEHGFRVSEPWFRGANADVNMTLAMAMTFFACWIVWAVQANGPIGFLLHLFAPKGETTGLLKVLMVFVFIAAGLLEVVSILVRPVSLSFRLYGNIFAGENMLEAMAKLIPGWLGSVLIPIPFYFMELLVGIVQALVFMLLTAVFTMLICEDPSHAKAHH
jgi:F-type H+-transporting ATPase subunit a